MKKNTIIFLIGIIILLGLVIYFAKANSKDPNTDNLTNSLTAQEFKKKIDNKESFILVATKSGCPYCEQFQLTLNDVVKEYNLDIYTINTTTFRNDEKEYFNSITKISGTPTTLFIVNGIEETTLNRLEGKVSKSVLVNRLRALNYIG